MPRDRRDSTRFILLAVIVAGALPALCCLSWFLLYLYLGASYLYHGDGGAFVEILTREAYVRWLFLAAAIVLVAWLMALRTYARERRSTQRR